MERDPKGRALRGALWGTVAFACLGVFVGPVLAGRPLAAAEIPGVLPWSGAGLIAGALYGALVGFVGVLTPHRPHAGWFNLIAFLAGGGLGFGAGYLYGLTRGGASDAEVFAALILGAGVGAALAMLPTLRFCGLDFKSNQMN
ncbi:MAG: hypothetical protein JKY65_22740 [Planctomycetes bacterium]|nr:hypothetical protein [Planctomycetota bacterium]